MVKKRPNSSTIPEDGVKVSSESKVLGIASLICGILSILTLGSCFMPEILAIVCGELSVDSEGRKTKTGKAGIICGVISCVLLVIVVVWGFLLKR